jgi:isocitrate dehydrogenase (NAD+)
MAIVRIAGDGVGPELVAAGTRVIEATGLPVTWVDAEAGAAAYARYGTTAPGQTLEALRRHRNAIKGPCHTPSGGKVRSGNYYLRLGLDLYACLRPLPVRKGKPPVLLVRENVEDLYGAVEWMATADVAQAVKVASRTGCERICRYALDLARQQGRRTLTVVHKANNLKLTEGIFLDTARAVAAEYPEVALEDMLADTAASSLILEPERFDVIVTSHTIGDLLSNVGAAVAGSLGLVGSLDSGNGINIAEASHGDAAELAGLNRVNPIGFLTGISLLLAAVGREREHAALAAAIEQQVQSGRRTLDLGGTATTSEVTDDICCLLGRR